MLIWLCALQCEAQPLIDAYRMKKIPDARGFNLFQADDVACVISGIGQLSMAAASAWTAATLPAANRCWINLGIAGHRELEIGSAVSINRISRADDHRSIYPVPLVRPELRSGRVITLDRESSDYHDEALYDMEAWAFASTLSRFDSLEAIQCIKVVSDNSASGLNRDKARISALIHAQLEPVIGYANALRTELESRHQAQSLHPELERFLSLAHFSATQKSQLAKLIPGLRQRPHDLEALCLEAQQSGRASEIIRLLQDRLQASSIQL